MIYELRCYVPVPGREGDLRRRFAESTLGLFARLGFEVVDFWEHAGGNGELWYLMRWQSEADMRQAWGAFRDNPEWLAVKEETEKDGPLVKSISSHALRRVEFFAPPIDTV